MHAGTHRRTGCSCDSASQGKGDIASLSGCVVLSSANRHVSFQLAQMLSILNKPSGVRAPQGWGRQEMGAGLQSLGSAWLPTHPAMCRIRGKPAPHLHFLT